MSTAIKLVISLLLCFGAAAIGGYATARSVTNWYLVLNKPSFNPPPWVFGPVWSLLYTFMAIALWKVWSLAPSHERNLDKIKAPKEKELALTWFFIQLALNTIWSFLFFYFQWPLGAFVEILILWIAILMTIIKFYALVPWTIWLLVPYLLWVSFAAFLNGTIAWLNM
jgi:benzodiazapine receptor